MAAQFEINDVAFYGAGGATFIASKRRIAFTANERDKKNSAMNEVNFKPSTKSDDLYHYKTSSCAY
jgi:hypothetical protein